MAAVAAAFHPENAAMVGTPAHIEYLVRLQIAAASAAEFEAEIRQRGSMYDNREYANLCFAVVLPDEAKTVYTYVLENNEWNLHLQLGVFWCPGPNDVPRRCATIEVVWDMAAGIVFPNSDPTFYRLIEKIIPTAKCRMPATFTAALERVYSVPDYKNYDGPVRLVCGGPDVNQAEGTWWKILPGMANPQNVRTCAGLLAAGWTPPAFAIRKTFWREHAAAASGFSAIGMILDRWLGGGIMAGEIHLERRAGAPAVADIPAIPVFFDATIDVVYFADPEQIPAAPADIAPLIEALLSFAFGRMMPCILWGPDNLRRFIRNRIRRNAGLLLTARWMSRKNVANTAIHKVLLAAAGISQHLQDTYNVHFVA